MITLLETLAVLASGCYGVLLARSKRMDAIGVFSVSFLAAFGGGTLRDVLLDRRPLFWIAREEYLWAVFALALAGTVLRVPRRLEAWLSLPDALGLGFFSVAGAGIALREGLSPFVASLFGVVTGAFGGVLADVVCNEVPRLFRPMTPLYGSCAFAGCWVFLLLRAAGCAEPASMWPAVLVIVAMRMAALRWDWFLPAAGGEDDPDPG